MRALADAARLQRFRRELAREADAEVSVYFTGGATAVLFGWRERTIDADILMVPERDALYRALPRLKEELQLNVEIVSPAHFIPELPGWRERSLLIEQVGQVTFYHYDPYSQALAKIERGHGKDLGDVAQLIARGLVEPTRLRQLFEAIEPQLYRYPAVDPRSFRKRLDEALPQARPTRLLLASQNRGKLNEMRTLLAGMPVEVVSPAEVGLEEAPEETGSTFLENARLKALHYSQLSGLMAVADDSGLCVDALDGGPGLQSARFGGVGASDTERNALLLSKLQGVPRGKRGAKFVCTVAVASGEAVLFEAEAFASGLIGESLRGPGGFGYDPLFVYPPLGRTFAQLDPAEKDRVSHRGQAFALLKTWLASAFPSAT